MFNFLLLSLFPPQETVCTLLGCLFFGMLLWETRRLQIFSNRMFLIQFLPYSLLMVFLLPFPFGLGSVAMMGFVAFCLKIHRPQTMVIFFESLVAVLLCGSIFMLHLLMKEWPPLSGYTFHLIGTVFAFPLLTISLQKFPAGRSLLHIAQVISQQKTAVKNYYLIWGIFQLTFLSSCCIMIFMEMAPLVLMGIQSMLLLLAYFPIKRLIEIEYQGFIRQKVRKKREVNSLTS
ncbi:MAG: hypothetical protein AAFY71_17685 [Bacteroidota bacterium]